MNTKAKPPTLSLAYANSVQRRSVWPRKKAKRKLRPNNERKPERYLNHYEIALKKLLNVQKKLKPIKKDSENPFHKSKYFDINTLLAEIKPHLEEEKLVLMQPLAVRDGKNMLTTVLVDTEHDNKDGVGRERIVSEIFLPDLQDPQKMGSAITYYRRYSLQSLLALEAEDDDANATIYVPPKPPAKPYTPPAKKPDTTLPPAAAPRTPTIPPTPKPVVTDEFVPPELSDADKGFMESLGLTEEELKQSAPKPQPGVKVEGATCFDCGKGTYIKPKAQYIAIKNVGYKLWHKDLKLATEYFLIKRNTLTT